MDTLVKWINPRYLDPATRHDIRESVRAKPYVKYIVLDDFFRTEMIDKLIAHHHTLRFDEIADRTHQGTWLPYDGAVKWADQDDVGADLYFCPEWHAYLADLVMVHPNETRTEVKLRYHKPDATGFWIHTDAIIRTLVAICYFNKGWRVEDGGLLQLWRVDDALHPGTPRYDNVQPTDRLDMLSLTRISTSTPGGGFYGAGGQHDLVLLDQIVPAYNRLFLCNFQHSPAYHSVTPSNGRARYGFVQWLHGLNWLIASVATAALTCWVA